MKKQYYMGQRIEFMTMLFGKPYFWMTDGDGVTYLVKARRHTGASLDGSNGQVSTFVEGWVPDFS